jgi:hypothetical protein
LQSLIEEELLFDAYVLLLYHAIAAGEDVDMLADVIDVEQSGLYTVVEVGGEVGDLVGEIDQLGFERGTLVEQIGRELWMLLGAVITRVLNDALADPKGEIEATMGGVTLLEVFNDAEGVDVVIEGATVTAETGVQSAFASMAKGGMADVMDQGEGLGEVFVEAECGGGGASDLRDLNSMGEATAEVVGGATGEDLGFSCEATEGASLHNALTVALEGRARGAKRRGIDTGQERIVRVSCDRASMQIDWHVQV